MCDCFHAVLPTWPGAPGSVSGRQLQPGGPDVETEDRSVTEGPLDETVRPRPQGSSPVYEYSTESAGFGVQVDAPGRRVSSGRRRSWWKRDSGDSRTFSSMSHPESVQETTEVTLKTEVEVGASGYSVTGGGDQGIFVKQVLKDSSAAKLFSLREGDQLLSATIFFDDIKYEDALKILQYSEPYRVQFQIKRKLPGAGDQGGAAKSAADPTGGTGKQDKEIPGGCVETPTKMLEADGDRERLLEKPRGRRGRRPRERLSWPKFQAIRTTRGLAPRRSHSSSEAYERGDTRDLSPTSTDTEAQPQVERQELKAELGSQRSRRFLNLRFKLGSGQGPSSVRQKDREAQGGLGTAGLPEHSGSQDEGPQDAGATASGRREDRAPGTDAAQTLAAQQAALPADTGLGQGAPGDREGEAARRQRKKKQVKAQEEATGRGETRTHVAPGRSWEAEREELQSRESGAARLSPQDPAEEGSTRAKSSEFRVRIRHLKTPKFQCPLDESLETKADSTGRGTGDKAPRTFGDEAGIQAGGTGEADGLGDTGSPTPVTGPEKGTKHRDTNMLSNQDPGVGERDSERWEVKTKVPKFKMPSFGWSPQKAGPPRQQTHARERAQEPLHWPEAQLDSKGPTVGLEGPQLDFQGAKSEMNAPTTEVTLASVEVDIQTPRADLEGDVALRGREVATKDSKFKVPKFKMPSLGMSVPGKPAEPSQEASASQAEDDVALPSIQAAVKTSEFNVQVLSTDREVKVDHAGVLITEGQLPSRAMGGSLKGDLTEAHMPKVDIKGPQGEVSTSTVEMALPSVDTRAPCTKLEGELPLGDKGVAAKDSKLKMTKFKMPSFSVSTPGKTRDATLEVSVPEVMALTSTQDGIKMPTVDWQSTSTNMDIKKGQVVDTVPEEKLPIVATGTGQKGHMPKVQMPSIKMPRVELKGPQLDKKGPKVDVKVSKGEDSAPNIEVTGPSVDTDIQAPCAKLGGDLALKDREMVTRDSKFKMPKFKMPSFGVSDLSKSTEASLEVSARTAEVDMMLPSVQGHVKTPDLSMQLPSTDTGIKTSQVRMTLPVGQVPEEVLPKTAAEMGQKGHLPKVEIPSIKTPKVGLEGPHLHIKGSRVDKDRAVSASTMAVALPSPDVTIQEPRAKLEGNMALEDTEVARKDRKFKMPKFKMPSFGVSIPTKSTEPSQEVLTPDIKADEAQPSVQGDIRTPELSVQVTSGDVEVKLGQAAVALPETQLPEGDLSSVAADASLKGHLPEVLMPSIKMPKVDLKSSQVNIKGTKMDVKSPKSEVSAPSVDVMLPSIDMDTQAPGARLEGNLSSGDKEVGTKDSKFKMPKFKMPSFGVSVPSKSTEASLEVVTPRVEVDMTLPPLEGDVKTADVSVKVPSADLEVETGQVVKTVPEGQVLEEQLRVTAVETGLKGHLPKVKMPSIPMPQVDMKGPQLALQGRKVDIKAPKDEVSTSTMEVALPSVEVDIQASRGQVESDLAMGDKEVAIKESKFKMPKVKMPSFGVSIPSKSTEPSLEVSAPEVVGEVTLPSVQGDIRTPALSAQVPSADMEIKMGRVHVVLPEGNLPVGGQAEAAAGAGLKGHLPKVQMPSVKMPRVDMKAPKVDVKGPKGEVSASAAEAVLPSVEVDSQAPGAQLEGDLAVGQKEVATRDSKFKMPKFKMPSFGVSAPGKTTEASVEVSALEIKADVALPSIQGDIRTPELSVQVPSGDVEVKLGQAAVALPETQLPEGDLSSVAADASLKGHLPEVPMPSIKMPKVDLKSSQVNIKGTKMDVKSPKSEVSAPSVDVMLPSIDMDTQAPGARLEGDLSSGDKEVGTKDSKFKMPKFKMPSFGVSVPSKSTEASLEVATPRVEVDMTLPPLEGDVKTADVSVKVPSADLEVKTGQVVKTVPEGQVLEEQLRVTPAETGLKGHLPKVKMPSIPMPQVDMKGPQLALQGHKVDMKAPKDEVSTSTMEVALPSVEVDIQASRGQVESDLAMGDKEVAIKESKFKMPKVKMPSFGVSIPSKSTEPSLEVSAPEVEGEVTLPSVQGDIRTPALSAQVPSADMEIKMGRVHVALPEGHLPVGGQAEAAAGAGLKGHLPKVQMPSVKMPRVDMKAPKVDVKGPKGEVSASAAEAVLPSLEVDSQAPGAQLEGDLAVGQKEVATRDSKFKMPSFGVSAPGKTTEASVEVSAPEIKADVTLPSVQGDIRTPELSVQVPSGDVAVKLGQAAVALPETQLPERDLSSVAADASLKGHLPEVPMPSIKMPKVDLKSSQVNIKGTKMDVKSPKSEVSAPSVDVMLPSVDMDTRAPGARLEGDLSSGDKEVGTKDSKFKMPKFKMPSFGVSVPSKSTEASLEVATPRVEVDMTLPTLEGDVKTADVSVKVPSADLEVKTGQVVKTVPEGQVLEEQLRVTAAETGLKGHLPKVKMPSIPMPQVDMKGPQLALQGRKVDMKAPKDEVSTSTMEVALPSVEVDIQASRGQVESDLAMGDKEVAIKESKFKMPKFKMPSFGVSVPSKSTEASLEVVTPRVEVDMTLPTLEGDVKTADVSVKVPSADLEVKTGQVVKTVPEGQVLEEQLRVTAAETGLKGHLPKVKMPSITMPQVDMKGPQLALQGRKVDMKAPKDEVSTSTMEVALPSVEVDIQASRGQLESDLAMGDKEVAIKESKFKMPKVKMPSFGVSIPSKSTEPSLEVSAPEVEGEVTLPSVQGDIRTPALSAQVPSADMEIKMGRVHVALPEGHLPVGGQAEAAAGAGLKGHLPKVQMPSVKMPRVDMKAPKVDVKGPKGEVSASAAEAVLPSLEVDSQAPGAQLEGDLAVGQKEVATRDSKFKMPKFKMPSFGVSAPGKTTEASVEVSAPEIKADVTLPSIQGDIRTPELSVQVPSGDVEVKLGQAAVALPETQLPEGDLSSVAADASLKGHLLEVPMPSIKMPKVDLKSSQVNIKDTKTDVKSLKSEVSAPSVDVMLPSVDMDTRAPGARLEGDLSSGDKEVGTKDSKFKMPKFKMPSFGVSVPSKSTEASLEVATPRVEVDMTLPTLEGDVKTADVSVKVPSADLEVKTGQVVKTVPEGQVLEEQLRVTAAETGLKGHLPKVKMPSIPMPQVDMKGPQLALQGRKVDMKAPKDEVSTSTMEVALPSVEVDIQASRGQVESDLAMGDKEVAIKESKFKMPKFKMPSFGVSVPSKSTEASLEVVTPRVEVDMTLPTLEGDVKTADVSVKVPSADLEVKTGQVVKTVPEGQVLEEQLRVTAAETGLKGHLPKVKMPSITMPQVDMKGPQLALQGRKVDMKAPKDEVSTSTMEVALPSVEVDIQASRGQLESDLAMGDKEVAIKESKFKMPKVKMPSFGVSIPSKSTEPSLEVSAPEVEGEVTLPSVQGDIRTPALSAQVPSADMEIKMGRVHVALPEGHLPVGGQAEAAAGAGLKGHLPKVQMPSVKMPRVDMKAPKVDVKGPKGEVSASAAEAVLPSLEVDSQAPGAQLEGDLAVGQKEVATRDSKFKMPKFKMPSFGVSAPGKTTEASVEVSAPEIKADVTLPSIQGDIRTPELSVQVPSGDVEVKLGQAAVALPETQLPEGDLSSVAADASLKGHLLEVPMPSIKMPKVDLKSSQVNIKDTKTDVKSLKSEVSAPSVDVMLPSVDMDTRAPGARLEGDLSSGDKEVGTKDSKFKMPKFKMPSFGVSVPSKSTEASLEVATPRVEVDMTLPTLEGDVKTADVSVKVPSADLEVKTGQVVKTVPEGQVLEEQLRVTAAETGLKGHLPKVKMPSIPMPQVDMKGPQLALQGRKVDMKAPKDEVSTSTMEVALPSVEVDIQASRGQVESDLAMGDKEVAIKESKFKMPKFKMPSFGVSVPSKSTEASLEVVTPRVEVDMTLPTLEGDVKTADVSVKVPSADLEVKTGQVVKTVPEGQVLEEQLRVTAAETGLKGHLPKVKMPSITMPQVDMKGPQLALQGRKVDMKAPKDEVSTSTMEVALPSVEVDIQASRGQLESDLAMGDKEVAIKESKFKMPKVKMPSFGVSIPSKSTEPSLEVSAPEVEGEVTLPSVQGDIRTPALSAQVPSADMEIKMGRVHVALPEGHLPVGGQAEAAAGAGLKGHLPKVQMPSVKMPRVDMKAPKVDVKGPKGEVSASAAEAVLPSLEVDSQAPGAQLEGDLAVGQKEVATRDSKFKMPKFKMPSFGVSAPGKTTEASVEVSAPEIKADVTLPSIQGDIRTPELSVQVPSGDVEVKLGQAAVALPETQLPEGDLSSVAADASLKGHLPEVPMPSIKMPKVDLKSSQVNIKDTKTDVKSLKSEVSAPSVDVMLPSIDMDTQAPGARLEGDLSSGDKEVGTKDSKFKMPKFKMPSFGVSVPSKSTEASLEVATPRVEVDIMLPPLEGDVKTADVSVKVPSADLEVETGQVVKTVPEGQVLEEQLRVTAAETGLKGHLPKVKMPSIPMPQVDMKGPQLALQGHKVDMKAPKDEVSTSTMEVALPSVEVDIQASRGQLESDLAMGDKEVAIKESKFKMPKVKMPSFGVSIPSKSTEPSLEVSAPEVVGEVTLPSVQGDIRTPALSAQVPSADMEIKICRVHVALPEGHLPVGGQAEAAAGAGLKGHLPKVQMPSVKMPRVDMKAPKVDVKGPKGEVSASAAEAVLPSVEVDSQAPGAQLEGDLAVGQKEVATRDSKFKMPKFKMPSFGVSAPGKTTEASVEVSALEIKADVALPSIQGDIRTPELSVQVPSGDVEVKLGQAAVALPETQLPEGDLSSVAADASLKGHLLEVPMPSIKMPKVDLKSSQVNIKGTKMDVKSPKSEVSAPSVDVMLPSVDMDTQAPGVQLEGDLSSGDKEVGTKDSKFKMPKFKMPSFRLSAPSKSLKASLEGPKLGMVMTPPSLHYDIKTPEASLQHPSVDPEVKVGQVGVKLPEAQLPEGELPPTATGTGLKGHLPKLQMPSMKMPMVDLRGPQLDIRGPKVDVKSSKGGVSTPATQVVLSSMEMDIPPPDASLEGDLALGNKEVAAKDSTFKMPKLKMPSFGVSAPGKLTEASLEVSAPKVKAKVALPCIHIDKSPEPSVRLPAADVELKEGQAHRTLPEGQLLKGALPGTASGMGPRGHLPKVQTPSVAMPPVDLNNTQPDIKGPFGLSGFSSGSLDLTCGPAPSVLLDSDSVTLTRAHPPALGSPAVPGVAPGASGGAPAVAALADPECSEAPLGGDLPCAQPDGQLGPVSPVFHIRLTFPKFHKPKFGVLVPVAPIPESGCPSEEPGRAQSVVPEQGPDSSAEGAPVCPLLSSQPSPPRVRVSTGLEGHLGPPVGTAPVEGSGRGGQGSPFKRPRFKRPSFSWSPKKQAGPAGDADLEDPTVSLTADPGRETTPPTTQNPHGDVDPDLLPSKTRSSGTSRRPGLAMPRLAFPKLKVPKGRAALSQDEDIAGEWEATDRAGLEGGGGVPATSEGPPEGEGTLPQLLHAHTPSASLSTAEGKVSYPVADLPLHRQEPDVGGGCQGLGLGVFSGSQPHGLEPAPSSGDPGSALGKQSEAPCAPGPELGASMSSDAEATESELPASVLRLPSAGALGTDPRPSEVRVRPAPGPPPLSALAEPHASPDPAEAGRPEGPVTLRASRTDVPSRASVVSAPGPWEDSVRSLTFPRLQVPRFSFPSPGPEPDVFFPIVAAGPGVQPTRREASLLPEGPGAPQEPPPGTSGAPSECQVSKARVHVSGPLGASRAVLAGRRETREGAEPESPEAGSARIVRESEVPGSAIQTPAFGFSLLRGRVPEAPAQAGVGRAAQAPGPQGAPATLPGEASPDSAEPFEAICARAGAPGAPTLAPEAPSGPRLAESGSDEEEPPEILEFPPEDSAEAAGVPEGRPGGRPAPGTLWAWLPRIGFSSAGETSVGARGDAGNRAPVQTQPAPRPDQEPAPRPEKASWLRLPRLGFASAPTKTTRGPEDQAGRARQEPLTFFDARESLSPEEGKEGEAAQGAGGSEGRWRPPRERGRTGAGAGEPQGNEGRLGDGPRAGHGWGTRPQGHRPGTPLPLAGPPETEPSTPASATF